MNDEDLGVTLSANLGIPEAKTPIQRLAVCEKK